MIWVDDIMRKLELKELSKHFAAAKSRGDLGFSIKPTSLTINNGEFLSLLGPSGCGKTTLLKLISGLMAPDHGEIFIDGALQSSIPPEKRGISMVFQQPLLFPHMTVEENVAFGLKMSGVRKKTRLNQASVMLSQLGLSGFEKRHPSELSGGQQQRVALARAFVMRSGLMLMDEPFSALDPELREDMHELLSELHRTFEPTILFVTHDRQEAFKLSDRIAVMSDGAIHQVASPEKLYRSPVDRFVATFLGAKNVIRGELDHEQFSSDFFRIPFPENKSHHLSGWLIIRPETVERTHGRQGILTGTILDTAFIQGFYHITTDINGFHLFSVEPSTAIRPAAGEQVTLQVNPSSLIFIPEKQINEGSR
jgi:ABC-type spermidine/putrescine transport systems, ATPase components